MSLLYLRFFNKVICDLGLVSFDEPFTRLFNQGTIVLERQKMSKSRGNVVNPDDYVARLGADTVRGYLMFVGPWEQGGGWDDSGISGIRRWLTRVWNVVLEDPGGKGLPPMDGQAQDELRRQTHKTVRKVTQDLERFHFNTMLSALMEFTNYLYKVREACVPESVAWREAIEKLLLMIAPSAPHLAEELWERTGRPYSIHRQSFPTWDEASVVEEQMTLVIQVNGKLRDRVSVPASITEAEVRDLALASERVRAHTDGKEVTDVIYVPGRLVNVVIRS
jgi:leucyl-tRNA synthetase